MDDPSERWRLNGAVNLALRLLTAERGEAIYAAVAAAESVSEETRSTVMV